MQCVYGSQLSSAESVSIFHAEDFMLEVGSDQTRLTMHCMFDMLECACMCPFVCRKLSIVTPYLCYVYIAT